MLEGWMHRFVRQGPDKLGSTQRFNKLRVEEQRDAIGRHGLDRCTGARAETKQQRSEEGMIEQERSPRLLDADYAR